MAERLDQTGERIEPDETVRAAVDLRESDEARRQEIDRAHEAQDQTPEIGRPDADQGRRVGNGNPEQHGHCEHQRQPQDGDARGDAVDGHHEPQQDEAGRKADRLGEGGCDRQQDPGEPHVGDDRAAQLHGIEAVGDRHRQQLEGDDRARQRQADGIRTPVEDEGHQQQVDPDERERIDQPLHELPAPASVSRPQVGRDQHPELLRHLGPEARGGPRAMHRGSDGSGAVLHSVHLHDDRAMIRALRRSAPPGRPVTSTHRNGPSPMP